MSILYNIIIIYIYTISHTHTHTYFNIFRVLEIGQRFKCAFVSISSERIQLMSPQQLFHIIPIELNYFNKYVYKLIWSICEYIPRLLIYYYYYWKYTYSIYRSRFSLTITIIMFLRKFHRIYSKSATRSSAFDLTRDSVFMPVTFNLVKDVTRSYRGRLRSNLTAL